MSIFKMIGTDTEFFVSRNNEIGSAIGKLGGSKKVPRLVKHGNVQEDNVLAEMAVDPCRSLFEWHNKIDTVHKSLSDIMSKQGYNLETTSSHRYATELLRTYPKEAHAFGCNRDHNVYVGKDNSKPRPINGLRTAAGHIHFSYVRPDYNTTCEIIKCMDYTLGLWSVLMDSDRERRQLYGKAGDCRIKPYGGEYRTLGNFWINNQSKLSYVYNVTKLCVEQHTTLLPSLKLIVEEWQLQEIINNYYVDSARLVLPRIQKLVNDRIEEKRDAA